MRIDNFEELQKGIIERSIPFSAVGEKWNRHTYFMIIPRTEHLLQIFVSPSFKSEYAVDFYEPTSSRGIENIKCVISIPKPQSILLKLDQPQSVIIIRRKMVEPIPEIAKQWLINSPKMKVSLDTSDYAIGLDGVGYEVQFGNSHWGACRFEWWVRPPSNWSEIGRMAQEILASLESEFNILRNA